MTYSVIKIVTNMYWQTISITRIIKKINTYPDQLFTTYFK